MFTAAETKIVVSTLNKRRAWLKKTLEDANQDPAMRAEHAESLKLIDSTLRKMAPDTVIPPVKRTMGTMRVLIAEDNADSANLLLDILQDFGMKNVDLAVDGIEAFDKIKKSKAPYDLVLCDWDMPELNGLEVHSKAKASNTLRGAHFMMVTAVSEASRIREAIQQGVNDYIVKPIDVDVLESKIKTALKLDPEPNQTQAS
ncbi:response regulator [Teredinibacter franksiae]|uniref:response regulator n=1 Tax=Teredinibacter franksiae TaxID=2761453 RepID=UPI001628814A|nr:response regulator [Teredinibacter franksiae]